jgi:5'-3' exonuclease
MILIIDVLHVYYRYWYVRDKLSPIILKSGRNVAHVKATLDACVGIMDEAAFQYDAAEMAVLVCLDRGSIKKDAHPEYKATRKHTLDDNNYAEIEWVTGTLANRGVVPLAVQGYEADDLVYTAVQKLGGADEIVIYTSDADLMMHAGEGIDVRVLRQKQYIPVTKRLYVKQVGFISKRSAWYNDMTIYKACVGDASDNIKGVRGFGAVSYNKRMPSAVEMSKDRFHGVVPSDADGALEFARRFMGFSTGQLAEFEQSLAMVFPLYCADLELPVRKIPIEQLTHVSAPAIGAAARGDR